MDAVTLSLTQWANRSVLGGGDSQLEIPSCPI